jgi:hypothetical protein
MLGRARAFVIRQVAGARIPPLSRGMPGLLLRRRCPPAGYPPVNRTLAVALLLGAPACPAVAQDTRAPAATIELERLKFQERLLEASLQPLQQHLAALQELEQQRATAGDYAGAIEARNQRKKLTTELERLDKELLLTHTREESLKARLLPDRIPLPLEAAVLAGDVRRDGGALTGWSGPEAAATWKLPDLPPGGYEVLIKYRCGALEGGTLEVREARFHLNAEVLTTLRGPQEKNLGTLKITDGSGTLVIRARSVLKDNLMHLLAVHLVPAAR